MKNLFVLVTGLALATSPALSASFSYSVTGEMLVRKFEGPAPHSNDRLKGNDYLDREVARGYISGVKDATEGTAWCARGKFKPDELDSELVATVKKLPAEKLRGNAAPLVLDVLRAKFPCSANRSKP